MDYNALRHLADSWGLIYLIVVFAAVVAFIFRPGARRHHDEAARIPLRKD